jgi:hypothetical protein
MSEHAVEIVVIVVGLVIGFWWLSGITKRHRDEYRQWYADAAKAYDAGAKGIEDRWDLLRESTEAAKEQNRLLQKQIEIMGELIVALRERK